MRVLSLFSGGGMGDYGLELAGMETSGQVEKDEYCQTILGLRWPDVPKWRDIHDVTGEEVRERCGRIDLIAGGFPCQPFSVAGHQRGAQDDRHLWPEMLRVIREVKPAWVVGENVPGLIRIALDAVLADLEAQGYETITLVLPAHALGAPHKRDRVWVVGYAEHYGRDATEVVGGIESGGDSVTERTQQASEPTGSGGKHGTVADTARGGFGGWQGNHHPGDNDTDQQDRQQARSQAGRYSWQWETEPGMGRVADGVPNRVERLKLLGNGQVVQAAQWVGEGVMQYQRIHDGGRHGKTT